MKPYIILRIFADKPNLSLSFFAGRGHFEAFKALIPAYILSFHVIHEGFIDNPVAPGSGVIACKIPVTGIGGTGFVQGIYRLKDDLYGCIDVGRGYELCDLVGDLLVGKGLIYPLGYVFRM